MRVAFTLIGGRNWTGGYNYLFNLLRSLSQHQPGRLMPVLFFGKATDPEDARPFLELGGIEVVQSSLFDEPRRRRGLLKALLWGRDEELVRLFAAHRIQAVFESAQFFGRRLGLPAVAWIPDFQHRDLPHLFTRAGYWKRELGFRAQICGGRTVMLSSEDSRQACERWYPSTLGRTRVVRFAVPPPAAIDTQAARALAEGYGLPERFFFMPNQFWRHKNHLLVVEALILLRKRGRSDVVVAASGRQADPRDPEHVPALQSRIAKEGLEHNFRLLGLLPHEQLPMLMKASTALLNPSLCEGWSTTVEEARASGVPMLLSDLPVHKEQTGELAQYFNRHSAESLADALEHFTALNAEERERLSILGAAAATERVKAFAADFVALVRFVAGNR